MSAEGRLREELNGLVIGLGFLLLFLFTSWGELSLWHTAAWLGIVSVSSISAKVPPGSLSSRSPAGVGPYGVGRLPSRTQPTKAKAVARGLVPCLCSVVPSMQYVQWSGKNALRRTPFCQLLKRGMAFLSASVWKALPWRLQHLLDPHAFLALFADTHMVSLEGG